MATYNKISIERFMEGQALRVILDAPKANILDGEMMGELNALLDELQTDKELKLICFTGSGKHFSFGASVPEHVGDKAAVMLAGFHGLFLRLIDLAVPTVAAVSGQCLGGGMELAAFCNWVVAHPGAKFAQPEIQLAVLPPVASLILPFKVGQSKADEINLTGRSIDAEEAKGIGLVDVIDENPGQYVERWAAEQFAPKSAAALRMALRASRWRFNQVFKREIKEVERFYLQELMGTADANEGLAAFLDKRKPGWTNA